MLLCAGAVAGQALAGQAPANPPATAPAGQSAGKTPGAASSNALPTADQVLAHYIRALGGEQVLRKFTARVMKGTFEVPAQQISGEAEIDMVAPDRFCSVVRIADAGEFVQAFDGAAGWSYDPQSGLRDITGPELDQLRRGSQFQHDLRFRELFPRVRVLERVVEEGRPAWVLEATPAGGPAEKFYFDTETGLLVRHDSTQSTPEGEQAIEHRYSDYITVDGAQFPSLLRHKDPSLEWRVKFTEIRNNVAIDAGRFAKPVAQ
ncbi:MAG TPA: hypothetical protein VJW51_10035 [Candidatus Acidoferrales bacterium]|nr:hypothetical protein [Candidatus Acidoferrales bacterium]